MAAMVLLDDFLRSIGVVYLTYYWVDAESQVVLDPRDVVSSESFRFIEEALNAAESVLIHSSRGQSRSCCILGAYMMRKYNWGLRKTMEFISFRRPDMNLKSSFMQQLSALERRLADKSKQTLSNDWTDANFSSLEAEDLKRIGLGSLLFDGGVAIITRHQNEKNMLWKDLLLRNTYLNGQMGPLAEFHSGMHDRHMPRQLWCHDKNRLEKPPGADRHNVVTQASELKGILRRKTRAMPRQTSGAGPTPVPAPIAPPAVEGTNGGYHRAPEVPTAWADEGEAPHYRGNLGFGLIECRWALAFSASMTFWTIFAYSAIPAGALLTMLLLSEFTVLMKVASGVMNSPVHIGNLRLNVSVLMTVLCLCLTLLSYSGLFHTNLAACIKQLLADQVSEGSR
eukprot:symbB.v1.2.014672.t1/scaffold1075.1/size141427/8